MKDAENPQNTTDGQVKNHISQRAFGCGDIVNDFIEDVWTVMTPPMIDRLKCILRDDMGLSKQDVDNFIESQREVRRQRICLKKNQRTVRIGPRNQWIKEVSKNIADQMAAMVVGLLLSNRTTRTKRITEKVLERLCEITGEDTTVESAKSRIERTLVVVADRMATLIDETVSEIEKKMQDKYMSAASLEAISIITDEPCPSSITSSLEMLQTESISSIFSDISKLESQTTLSVVTIDPENKEVTRKSEEKVDEVKEDEESKVTDAEASSYDESGSSEFPVEELEVEEEEEDDEETEEENEETEDDEAATEEESETFDEETEPEEFEEEEDAEEEEYIEGETDDLEEEEEEDKETEIEDAVDVTGEEEENIEDADVLELGSEVHSEIDFESIEQQESVVSSMEKSSVEQEQLQGDILDLLKEDITNLSREEEESERQIAMKEIIDRRLKKIAKDKLNQSLDSIMKYDIDEAASIVANWVEKILASADSEPQVPSGYKSLGPAFEVKRGSGSQFEVNKISSTTVAKKVAEVRGLDPPTRKKKIPRNMAPMNLQSGKDWADWALDAADVGEKLGDWLDNTINEARTHLLSDRAKKNHRENYSEWAEWRDKRAQEALKWRVEQQKMRDEGKLWGRKMRSGQSRTPELVTAVRSF